MRIQAAREQTPADARLSGSAISDYTRSLVIVTAGWLLIAVTWSVAMHLSNHARGISIRPWWRDFFYLLVGVTPWLAATPLLLWLGNRFSISRPHPWRNLAIQAVAAFALLPTLEAIGLALNHIPPFATTPGLPKHFLDLVLINTFFAIPTYVAVVGIGHAVAWLRRARSRERQLAQVQLTALRTQLNPHFLFNTLNAVTAAGYRDPELSDRVLTRLGELLRASLACDQQTVPLSEEIAFLKAYIEIHQLLVRNRVQFELQVQPDVWQANIPPMLLQPLVENAVIHGAHDAGRRANTVRLLAEKSDNKLRITIENDLGPEMEKTAAEGQRLTRGIGLRNTRERLQVLYGEKQDFSFTREAGRRAAVTLAIPFTETAEGAA